MSLSALAVLHFHCTGDNLLLVSLYPNPAQCPLVLLYFMEVRCFRCTVLPTRLVHHGGSPFFNPSRSFYCLLLPLSDSSSNRIVDLHISVHFPPSILPVIPLLLIYVCLTSTGSWRIYQVPLAPAVVAGIGLPHGHSCLSVLSNPAVIWRSCYCTIKN